MNAEIINLVSRLADDRIINSSVISWGSPVPSFGDLSNASIATIGLNPSNLEFVDEKGKELDGSRRRFHTLNSLGSTRYS